MQIIIDTPYVTVGEFAKRSGQLDSSIRREIELGRSIIRPEVEGSKAAVLINIVHLAMEAAKQVERARVHSGKARAK